METLIRDVRHGARLLRQQPGFTLSAVAVLALGIGANSAIFSLVNAFLLKPLVVERPEELVGLYSREVAKPDAYRGFSYAEYLAIQRAGEGVFAGVTAHNMAMVGLSEEARGDASGNGSTTRRVFADVVAANYFDLFGAPLFRGRTFTAEEERPGSAVPVVIVGHSFWKRTGSDPDLVGKTLRLNGVVCTVVGIAAPGFSGTTALFSAEVYLPLGMHDAMENDFGGETRSLAAPDSYPLILIGRLRPGLTPAAADAQLEALSRGLDRSGPRQEERRVVTARLSRLSISTSPTDDGDLRLPSILLLSMSGIVLLIASLNVANMMLARGAARSREISIRLAMGASRRSVLLQLTTEGLLLAALGGVAGLGVAAWSTTALVRSLARLAPIELVYSAAPDLRILAATFAFCLLSTLLFALSPALHLSRPDVYRELKGREQGGGGGRAGGRRLFSRRNVLVLGQLSLSLMLLTAAGLFLRSSLRSADLDPGFDTERGIVVELDPSLAGLDEARSVDLYRRLVDRLAAVPGVEAASVAATVPFGMISLGRTVQRASDPPPAVVGDGASTSVGIGAAPGAANSGEPGDVVASRFNIVGPDYFRVLGIALLRGRPFEEREARPDAGRVVIVNQALARQLWPDGEALGQRVRLIGDDRGGMREAEIVGVAADVREHIVGVAAGPQPQIYVPFGQEAQSNLNLHLRASVVGEGAEGRMLEAVRREIRAVDEQLPILSLKTMRRHLEDSFDFWLARTAARMFLLLGGVALLMAVIGLYGVRAYSVARRTREIGVRMAIGASARDALRMVLGEGLRLAAVGVAIGLLLALALGKVLSGMLYEVSGVDPLAFAGAAVVLAAASLLACYVPARRAAGIEPMAALRDE
jgi:predicted permease